MTAWRALVLTVVCNNKPYLNFRSVDCISSWISPTWNNSSITVNVLCSACLNHLLLCCCWRGAFGVIAVSTFSSVSTFFSPTNIEKDSRNLPFLSLPLSLSCILLFCHQNHIENIVYNWCLIAPVATVLLKPTRSATKACGKHTHAKEREDVSEAVHRHVPLNRCKYLSRFFLITREQDLWDKISTIAPPVAIETSFSRFPPVGPKGTLAPEIISDWRWNLYSCRNGRPRS